MKKILILSFAINACMHASGQVKFSNDADVKTEVSTATGGEDLEDDMYTIYAHLPCENALQEEIWNDFNGIKVSVSINGYTVPERFGVKPENLFSFQKDESEDYLIEPSIQSEIELSNFLDDAGSKCLPKGNVLEVTYTFKDQVLGKGQITFDIPEFTEIEGDFCGFEPTNLEDAELIKKVQSKFASEYSKNVLVKIFTSSILVEYSDGSNVVIYSVLCTSNGIYQNINYECKIAPDGSIKITHLEMYDQMDIHPDCVKAFLGQ